MPNVYLNSAERPPVGAGALALCLVGVGSLLSYGPAAAQALFPVIAPLPIDTPVGYFVASPDAVAGARPGDAELCVFALEDWVRHAEGRLVVQSAPEVESRIRIFFVAPGRGQYGEMRPVLVGGRRGAEVFIRPDTDSLSPDIATAARQDPLLRDAIVYLTCLHEIGHALGMEHTDRIADVMYYFGFGGDIPGFFNRYRSRLESRDDIPGQTGLSAGDIAGLRSLWPDPGDGASTK
jgi:hypothetical protein